MTAGTDTDGPSSTVGIKVGPAAAMRQGILLEEKIRNGSQKQRLRRWAFRAHPEQHGRSLAGRVGRVARVRWIGRAWPDPRPQPRDDSGSKARVPAGRRLPAYRKLCGDNS